MKKVTVFLLSFAAVLTLMSPRLNATAAPAGYWPYWTAYESAVSSGNVDKIMSAGDAVLAFFSNYPIDSDIAGMSYNIYFYRYTNAIFEKRGDYDAAIRNAEKLEYDANYLGFTDAAIAARARSQKLDPMTEVYALSNAETPAAYYGAKYEPQSGAYYGRAASTSPTQMGVVRNAGAIANESIVSVYVQLGTETASMFSWEITPFDDGKHIIQLALNFPPDEAATAAQVAAGAHDDNIKATLRYLAALHSPVFLRIGGEMNLWGMNASVYRDAYIRVAALARAAAPSVALVWSPNCVGSWGSNLADFYPGDTYVDWVGMSLYNDPEPLPGETPDDDSSMYFGRGAFADCVLSAKEVCTFALAHRRPVIVTEGGMGLCSNVTGKTYDAEASAQITKRYTVLNMVFPNIKAIVYFDANYYADTYKYGLWESSAVNAAYGAAVASNPTLMSKSGMEKPSYVRLSDYCAPSGTIDLYAYSDTVYGGPMTIKYYLSGTLMKSSDTYPYHLALDTAPMTAGNYRFDAVFDDGAGYMKTKTYTLTKLTDGNVIFSDGFSAVQDMPADWSKGEVELAAQNNLIPDVLRTRFSTDITRQNFCRLVISLVEQKTGKTIDQVLADRNVQLNPGVFSDTTEKYVLAASALGIVSGRGNGLFDGSAGITREEAAKMLKNAADVLGIKQNGAAAAFLDSAGFSPWAVTSIQFVSSTADAVSGKLVMGGIGNSRFGPKEMYSYQQAYMTMLRLYRAG